MTSQPSLPNLNSYITWLIASFFAFFQFFLQTTAGVFGIEWMRDFDLNNVGLSYLSAAFFYTYVFMQIPAGFIFDHYQPRYILASAAFILTLGISLLAYTDSYSIALIARLFMGIGSAFGFVGLLQVCATYFPPNRFILMLGITEGMSMLALTASVMLLTWLVARFSWRITLYGCAGITFTVMLTALWFLPKQTNTTQVDETHTLSAATIVKHLKIIFTNKQVFLGSLYGFFMFAIVNAFTSLWGISFLTTTYSLSQQMAANMTAMVFIGIAIGGPLSGWLSKFIQHRYILIVAGAFATLSMSIIIFSPRLSELVLFILFLFSGIFCASYVQCFAVIKDSVEPIIRATALATTNMVIMLGAPILQLTIGWLLQNHFFGFSNQSVEIYRLSLGILPAGMFIAFVLAFWIKPNPQKQNNAAVTTQVIHANI